MMMRSDCLLLLPLLSLSAFSSPQAAAFQPRGLPASSSRRTAAAAAAPLQVPRSPHPLPSSLSSSSTTARSAVTYDQCLEAGYRTSVPKPMGVVFGENADPYYGLSVDDVGEGLNGGRAGLRVGDQLLAVGDEVVVGGQFDSVMAKLQDSPGPVDLVLYRGPVASLFTILSNQIGEGESVGQSTVDDADDDEGEEIVMDEDYESPVKVEVKEQKPWTAGEVFSVMGKLGKALLEDDAPPPQEVTEQPEGEAPKKKGGGGFFGIGAEAIQLDGDDATSGSNRK